MDISKVATYDTHTWKSEDDVTMSENLRSQIVTQGVQRSPNRAMLRAVGFKNEDFNKAIVGIANGYSTITPCNMGINQLAQRAEVGIKTAGAMPQMFGTITISDGISMGTEGMKYSLVSREVIADSIETACTGQSMDGVLAIGGCDKNMPGAMLAIARMNIPAIIGIPLCVRFNNSGDSFSSSTTFKEIVALSADDIYIFLWL